MEEANGLASACRGTRPSATWEEANLELLLASD